MRKRKFIPIEEMSDESPRVFPSPTSEDKFAENAGRDIKNGLVGWEQMKEDIRIRFGSRFDNDAAKITRYFENYVKRNKGKDILRLYTSWKSVYRVAMDNRIDYRRLLSTLRRIDFPLSKRDFGKQGNFVIPIHFEILGKVMSKIGQLWAQEDARSEWISFLKETQKWSKSRISMFISRRGKNRRLHTAFFELVKPHSLSRGERNAVLRRPRGSDQTLGHLMARFDGILNGRQPVKEQLETLRRLVDEDRSLLDPKYKIPIA